MPHLGALSGVHECRLNPQVRTHSGTVPGTSRSTDVENRKPYGGCSQNDPHPEVGPSVYQSHRSLNSDPNGAPHMITGVQEESPYCSFETSSGKQMKVRSTSQSPFHSENNPAKIEADQTLMALQQLASKNKSGNFTNKFNTISKLPKCLATTMSTFDWKSGKFDFFEDLFQRCLKIHNQPTEDDKIDNFDYFMRADALQTFRNISNQ